MSYKQILKPNLDNDPNHPLYIYIGGQILTDWYGWCLAVCAGSFGAKGSSYSAKTAWQACNTKHYGFDIPEKVWVPVWWEGGTYGHIAQAYRDGNHITVYSSPYTHKATFEVFESDNIQWLLNYIGQIYRVGNFTGWSETLLDSKIIEPVELKSNEDICKEVWEGKWGTGRDRKNRLTEAGYDYDTIQSMVDKGIGKPEPVVEKPVETPQNATETTKEPETINNTPEPSEQAQNASETVTEHIETEPIENNDRKEEDMSTTNEPIEPAQEQDQQLITGYIQEASKGFTFPNWVKLTAYIVGDVLLVGALLIPDVVNASQAPTVQIWAEYASRVLLEAGVSILTIFKLIKK